VLTTPAIAFGITSYLVVEQPSISMGSQLLIRQSDKKDSNA
jgi:hypothetical protein